MEALVTTRENLSLKLAEARRQLDELITELDDSQLYRQKYDVRVKQHFIEFNLKTWFCRR